MNVVYPTDFFQKLIGMHCPHKMKLVGACAPCVPLCPLCPHGSAAYVTGDFTCTGLVWRYFQSFKLKSINMQHEALGII